MAITIQEAQEILNRMKIAKQKNPLKTRQTPYIQAQPGVGKSAFIKQLAQTWDQEDKNNGGPGWDCFIQILSQVCPEDLKGAPFYMELEDVGLKVTSNCPPQNLPLLGYPQSAKGKNILIFLDEMRQAPTVIQNLAGNIMDGVVGDYQLDQSRIFIVIASNRDEDNSAVQVIPANQINRICILDIAPSYKEWESWALINTINPIIISFLNSQQKFFLSMPTEAVENFPTPRVWVEVSNYLDTYDPGTFMVKSPNSDAAVISGWLGQTTASAFLKFIKRYMADCHIVDILNGKFNKTPTSVDLLFGLQIEGVYRIDEIFREAKGIGIAQGNIDEWFKANPNYVKYVNNFYKWLVCDEVVNNTHSDASLSIMACTMKDKTILDFQNRTITSYAPLKEASDSLKYLMQRAAGISS